MEQEPPEPKSSCCFYTSIIVGLLLFAGIAGGFAWWTFQDEEEAVLDNDPHTGTRKDGDAAKTMATSRDFPSSQAPGCLGKLMSIFTNKITLGCAAAAIVGGGLYWYFFSTSEAEQKANKVLKDCDLTANDNTCVKKAQTECGDDEGCKKRIQQKATESITERIKKASPEISKKLEAEGTKIIDNEKQRQLDKAQSEGKLSTTPDGDVAQADPALTEQKVEEIKAQADKQKEEIGDVVTQAKADALVLDDNKTKEDVIANLEQIEENCTTEECETKIKSKVDTLKKDKINQEEVLSGAIKSAKECKGTLEDFKFEECIKDQRDACGVDQNCFKEIDTIRDKTFQERLATLDPKEVQAYKLITDYTFNVSPGETRKKARELCKKLPEKEEEIEVPSWFQRWFGLDWFGTTKKTIKNSREWSCYFAIDDIIEHKAVKKAMAIDSYAGEDKALALCDESTKSDAYDPTDYLYPQITCEAAVKDIIDKKDEIAKEIVDKTGANCNGDNLEACEATKDAAKGFPNALLHAEELLTQAALEEVERTPLTWNPDTFERDGQSEIEGICQGLEDCEYKTTAAIRAKSLGDEDDNPENCPGWAGVGDCTTDRDYMTENCQFTCAKDTIKAVDHARTCSTLEHDFGGSLTNAMQTQCFIKAESMCDGHEDCHQDIQELKEGWEEALKSEGGN